jgi:hypothetical protein
LLVAVPPAAWKVFAQMTPARFAKALRGLCRRMDLRRYQKHPRGEKKKRTPQTHGRCIKHISTARILAARNPDRRAP